LFASFLFVLLNVFFSFVLFCFADGLVILFPSVKWFRQSSARQLRYQSGAHFEKLHGRMSSGSRQLRLRSLRT